MITTTDMEKGLHIIREAESKLSILFGFSVVIRIELYERRLEVVFEAVCEVTKQPLERIKSETKTNELVYARYFAYKLIKDHLRYTVVAIGKIFNRDHSTVVTGLQTFDDLYRFNPEFKGHFDKCEALFLERTLL